MIRITRYLRNHASSRVLRFFVSARGFTEGCTIDCRLRKPVRLILSGDVVRSFGRETAGPGHGLRTLSCATFAEFMAN